jgi:hypothetical protein
MESYLCFPYALMVREGTSLLLLLNCIFYSRCICLLYLKDLHCLQVSNFNLQIIFFKHGVFMVMIYVPNCKCLAPEFISCRLVKSFCAKIFVLYAPHALTSKSSAFYPGRIFQKTSDYFPKQH